MKLCSVSVAGVLIGTAVLASCSGFAVMDGGSYLDRVPVHTPPLTGLEDGEYRGSYVIAVPAGSIAMSRSYKAVVTVSTEDGVKRIAALRIVHPESFPDTKFIPTMVDRILAAQSLDVDAYSGASFSSKALLKAVEDALDR
jgi:uncharacterized protein with FMN-binding domain